MMLKSLASATIIAATTMIWPTPVAGQDSTDSWRAEGVTFPAAVDTFVVETVHRWVDDPTLGIVITYVTFFEPSFRGDVYVYPVGDADSVGDLASLVRREYDDALEGVRVWAEQQIRVDELSVEEEGERVVSLHDDVELAGSYAVVALKKGNVTRRSLLFVFRKDDSFMKFRVSHDPALTETLTPHIDRFIADVVRAVDADTAAPPQSAPETDPTPRRPR